MDKLNDGIHNCHECEIYPCSFQEEVSRSDICVNCPAPCCRSVIVPLAPCEKGKIDVDKFGALKMNDDGWCSYYNYNIGCTIYEKRPIICRIASCRFIREGKMPNELKIIKFNRERNNNCELSLRL